MSEIEDVWIVDDTKSIRQVLAKRLSQAGLRCATYANGEALFKDLERTQPRAIISDVRMPGMDGLQLLKVVQQRHPNLPIVVMTAYSDIDSTVAAYRGGAFDYLPKPFDLDRAAEMLCRAVRESRGDKAVAPEFPATDIIGQAPAMQEVFRAIGRLSQSNATVLLEGESGTGKELVARALHRHGPRHDQPFIALNMADIPRELLESELFGHVRGAFTGATEKRSGRFTQADSGTLFLDEIGDMPPETQTRLLRVLANGEFFPVGGHAPVQVNVRIIAATHRNLETQVADSTFREDLYHRLNVIRIRLPRLAERRRDIPQLAAHFLAGAAAELQQEPRVLTTEAEEYLCALDWPGNVRQLENLCHWVSVMTPGREVQVADLPPELQRAHSPAEHNHWEQLLADWAGEHLARGERRILAQAAPAFERALIRAALKHSRNRKREAAELLGWGRNTLTRKIRELGLD